MKTPLSQYLTMKPSIHDTFTDTRPLYSRLVTINDFNSKTKLMRFLLRDFWKILPRIPRTPSGIHPNLMWKFFGLSGQNPNLSAVKNSQPLDNFWALDRHVVSSFQPPSGTPASGGTQRRHSELSKFSIDSVTQGTSRILWSASSRHSVVCKFPEF